ncbi:heme lyase CcmF/NrfE family subunit [Mariluticola halotolerans]|uniref:heme lyase CcmF/NrfE family subunit n=1 Tax=Mariluticola halotolerans TaxID=2909283 RepID=UPI0026E261AC|nr:heme lyase CcmF/NrfE family subunit [Mariluticola halotolerans]UJQ95711.1 heme lyase CcmF/NrfE family subunit [Mariluticola halotolerans]
MWIELGHFALVLAFVISLAQAGLGLTFWRGNLGVARFARQAAIWQCALVAIAFATLVHAFVTSDFSVSLAFQHSFSQQPLLYKITSVWGNHEGSILLWVLILVAFGAAVAAFGRNLPGELRTLVLAVQGLLGAAFMGFALFTSNPFARLDPAPFEGRDLNPILQDIGLAIHPPLLYIGYVGFSVCFSFAVAALISGRVDAAWARWVRPWTLASWTFLTLGIAMGSYWAYYELGWGGWWFWDPVENASFMPWLAGTALLHSALVMEKRNALKIWTIFLAIITFSLSLLGTFLVRSGVLTSVHSFASDPTRGLVILGLLAFFIGGAFTLFAFRAASLRAGGLFAPISREGALILNNLFLATATVAVLVGTLYPLILDAVTGARISVGPPFFNMTFGALMLPLLVVLPFGPFLAWKRGDLVAVTQRLVAAAGLAVFATMLVFIFSGAQVSLAPLGFLAGFWVAFGAIADLADRGKVGRVPLAQSWRRLIGLPKGAWSTAIAHFGMGITVLGVVAVSTWETENITVLKQGETAELAGYEVTLASLEELRGPNFVTEELVFSVNDPFGNTRQRISERRVYIASRMPTTEAAILTYGLSQLYIAVGDADNEGGHVVRIWHKPYITLIWWGAVIMAIAGFWSLSDRRLRVGAPRKVKPQLKAAE